MRVELVQHDGDRVVASVRTVGSNHTITWRLPVPAAREVGDALAATALFPAMATGHHLRVEPLVSPRLLAGLPTIEDLLLSWESGPSSSWSRVPVEAVARRLDEHRRGNGIACFFTGGVDSFYSVLRHLDELDALVFVHGFDVPLDATAVRDGVSTALRAAATSLGVRLLEVETDVRAFSDRYVDWRDRYHGAALAAVALLLAPTFHRVYIPASMTLSSLAPLGSHPLVDPLWSTEDVDIVHDGCEANRLEKLEVVASNEAACTSLRVCAQSYTGAYNCGRCEKCLRTMVAIRALGLEGRFRSMPVLDEHRLRAFRRHGVAGTGATWQLALEAAGPPDEDRPLVRALRPALRRRRYRALARPLVRRAKVFSNGFRLRCPRRTRAASGP